MESRKFLGPSCSYLDFFLDKKVNQDVSKNYFTDNFKSLCWRLISFYLYQALSWSCETECFRIVDKKCLPLHICLNRDSVGISILHTKTKLKFWKGNKLKIVHKEKNMFWLHICFNKLIGWSWVNSLVQIFPENFLNDLFSTGFFLST